MKGKSRLTAVFSGGGEWATFITIDTVVKSPATPIMSITPFSPNFVTARR
jgi:hypothetical protein